MKDYSLREQTEKILAELKSKGFGRDAIEKELGYSDNYIDQQLSKGSNNRFLNAIKSMNARVLQKATSTNEAKQNETEHKSGIDDLAYSQRVLVDAHAKMIDAFLHKLSMLDEVKFNLEKKIPDSMTLLTDLLLKGQENNVSLLLEQFSDLKKKIASAESGVSKKILQNQKR